MAKFDYSDDSVVVIIGSGAGGGTLANELCQKGIKVVVLEAGAMQSPATFINDEWKSVAQIAWLEHLVNLQYETGIAKRSGNCLVGIIGVVAAGQKHDTRVRPQTAYQRAEILADDGRGAFS